MGCLLLIKKNDNITFLWRKYEEDVDAYFAGTLVFYEQDEIPLTE